MPPKFRWNQRANRYVDRKGKFVSWQTVSNEIDTLNKKLVDQNKALAESFRDGSITIDEFQTQLFQNIKTIHLSPAILQAGGWEQLNQSDFGFVGRIIRDEYELARNMFEQIADGRQLLDGTFIRRVGQYGQQANVTYYALHDRDMFNRGFDLEASRLNPADHCEECISESNRGFVPIGQLVPVGRRICRSGCKCNKLYKNSITNEIEAI